MTINAVNAARTARTALRRAVLRMREFSCIIAVGITQSESMVVEDG